MIKGIIYSQNRKLFPYISQPREIKQYEHELSKSCGCNVSLRLVDWIRLEIKFIFTNFTLYGLNCLSVYAFAIICRRWEGVGSWNPSSRKARILHNQLINSAILRSFLKHHPRVHTTGSLWWLVNISDTSKVLLEPIFNTYMFHNAKWHHQVSKSYYIYNHTTGINSLCPGACVMCLICYFPFSHAICSPTYVS